MLYILPDSAGDILIAQATGTLTQDDYDDVFLAQIAKQLKPNHKLRILIYLDHDFTAIAEDSHWHREHFFTQCPADIIRVAIVASDQYQYISDNFKAANVKHFAVSDFLTALHWTDEANI